MSLSNTMENLWLLHLLHNADIANIGDAGGLRGSVTAGNLYWALFTADPGEAGSAVTNETAYTGYARVAAPRSASGFTISANVATPPADVDFPVCTANPGGALTHAALVNTSSGAGTIIVSGTYAPNLTMTVGAIPRIKTTSTFTLD